MFDRERAEMAAGFARELIPHAGIDHAETTPFQLDEILDGIVDQSLRMADRIIAACTKPAPTDPATPAAPP